MEAKSQYTPTTDLLIFTNNGFCGGLKTAEVIVTTYKCLQMPVASHPTGSEMPNHDAAP